MQNRTLAADYIRRATVRLGVLDLLFEASSWPDVVREAQEVVELALKSLLRAHGIEPPRIHDVSSVLDEERSRFPDQIQQRIDELTAISRDLRRDRELAFYGAEDLTPGEFYTAADAERARKGARHVVATVAPVVETGI